MLLKVAPHIAECLEHARASRERAENENDPLIKEDFLAIEQHWLRLAASYRRVERMEVFISEAERRAAMMQSEMQGEASDAEVERLAERMVGKPNKPLR